MPERLRFDSSGAVVTRRKKKKKSLNPPPHSFSSLLQFRSWDEADARRFEHLHNLQILFQQGFLSRSEFRERRRQLVDELTGTSQPLHHVNGRTRLQLPGRILPPILYRPPPDFATFPLQTATKHSYNHLTRTWTSTVIQVKVDPEPFAKGGLRMVYHLQDLSTSHPHTTTMSSTLDIENNELVKGSQHDLSDQTNCAQTTFVAKVAIDPNENPETYFRDVEMQALAGSYAALFNSYNPPRRVTFLDAWVLQFTSPTTSIPSKHVNVERFISGKYHKHNNNFGYVETELERNTPQAFSHFTYEVSNHQILIVDIQGVQDHYTDPQIHTTRGQEFGKGNLSIRGFERFLATHRCNPICRYLKLPLINPKYTHHLPSLQKSQLSPTNTNCKNSGTIPAQTLMKQAHIDFVDYSVYQHHLESRSPSQQQRQGACCIGNTNSILQKIQENSCHSSNLGSYLKKSNVSLHDDSNNSCLCACYTTKCELVPSCENAKYLNVSVNEDKKRQNRCFEQQNDEPHWCNSNGFAMCTIL